MYHLHTKVSQFKIFRTNHFNCHSPNVWKYKIMKLWFFTQIIIHFEKPIGYSKRDTLNFWLCLKFVTKVSPRGIGIWHIVYQFQSFCYACQQFWRNCRHKATWCPHLDNQYISIAGMIIAVGGWNESSVERYDFRNRQWSLLNNFTKHRDCLHVSKQFKYLISGRSLW